MNTLRSMAMLNRAGRDMKSVRINLLIPLAALTTLRTLKTLNTRTTRSRVGETVSGRISSRTKPVLKSNVFWFMRLLNLRLLKLYHELNNLHFNKFDSKVFNFTKSNSPVIETRITIKSKTLNASLK